MNTPSHDSDNVAVSSMLTGNDLTSAPAQRIPRAARWLALGTIVGPVLFTLAWIVLGFLSPGYTAWGIWVAPYSPISQPISGLGLGVTAPFMNTAFVLCGLILLGGVVGVFGIIREIGAVTRWSCAVLLGLSPLGMVTDGIFTLQSFFPHFMGFVLGCGTPVVSFLVTGFLLRRIPRWRRFGTSLMLGSPLTLALTILYFMTFSPTVAGIQTGVAGLTERILVIEVYMWFVVLGWLAIRQS